MSVRASRSPAEAGVQNLRPVQLGPMTGPQKRCLGDSAAPSFRRGTINL
ncbi:MAG: hypothetical protein QOH81_1192 [Sphingomonadales bacterium]|jgi:hypothetical protein|nr:hypothetical protein [Sphingomonadales bacterium]